MAQSVGDTKSVEKVLGGMVSCRFVFEVRVQDGALRKSTQLLALVCDLASKKEYALALFKTRKVRTKGLVFIPIYADFRIFVRDFLVFNVTSRSLAVDRTCEALSETVLNIIVSNLTKVFQIANKEGYRLGGASHAWIGRVTGGVSLAGGDTEAADAMSSPANRRSLGVEGEMVSTLVSEASSPDEVGAMRDAERPVDPGVGQSAVMFDDLKEEWIQKEMKARTRDFTETIDSRIFLGTYNVGTEEAAGCDLTAWLAAETDPAKLPDMFALGFQEVDMSAEAVILNDISKGKYWEELVARVIMRLPVKFVMVASKQLVGILICVYVRAAKRAAVRDVALAEVGCGLMGKMGNKGAVAIRLTFYDSTLCFVNAHLASGQDYTERRNQDYREICRRMAFGTGESIFENDFVVFMGDFNYRISLSREEVLRLAEQKNFEALLRFDQLNIEKRKGSVLDDFVEAPIRFAPTYKYNPNSQVYDTSEKKRIPAYCDRILMRGDPNAAFLSYRRHEILHSDHRPISAVVRLPLQGVIEEKRHQAYSAIVRELDRLENECMPDASVSQHTFVFADVRYGVRQTQTLELENTGQVLVQYRFIPKLGEKSVCKSWLSVSPSMGILIPGDKTRITFTMLVDNRTAPALNRGDEKLEDILILHLENGKDHFVAVSGVYLRSCFGCELEELIWCGGPVRSLEVYPPTSRPATPLSVPRELWTIIDYIVNSDEMGSDRMFRVQGLESEMSAIRECLDTGSPLTSIVSVQPGEAAGEADARRLVGPSVASMSAVLIELLDSLVVPLIPNPLSARLLDHAGNYQLLKGDVTRDSGLPQTHRNVFVYVIYFLREVLARATSPTAELLESLGPAVCGRPTATRDPQLCKRQALVLTHFLTDPADFV